MYRIIKKKDKYYPQFFNIFKYKYIDFDGTIWDDYSGKFSRGNAHQRLYMFMGKKMKVAWSIFSVGKIENLEYFDFLPLKISKENCIKKYKRYKGKTEFMKNIFPEYFN